MEARGTPIDRSWRSSLWVISFICLLMDDALAQLQISTYGNSGDILYTSLLPLASSLSKNHFVGSPNYTTTKAMGAVFGTIYDQFALNNSILDCTALVQNRSFFDYVCLVAPNATTPSIFQLIKYRPQYLAATNFAASNLWYPQLTWNITLVAGKNYSIFPTDSRDLLYIVAAEFNSTANETIVTAAVVKYTNATASLAVVYDRTSTPFKIQNLEFDLKPFAKISTQLPNSIMVFNTPNSTLPYDTSSQPSNSKVLLITLSAAMENAWIVELPVMDTMTGASRVPSHLMDVDVMNETIYYTAVDLNPATNKKYAVLMAMRLSFSVFTPPTLTPFSTFGVQPVQIQELDPNRNVFFHFAFLKNRTTGSSTIRLLIRHEHSAAFDSAVSQPIRMNAIYDTGLWPNVNLSSALRPLEANAEIRVSKFGITLNQINIVYLINGSIVYVDNLNTYAVSMSNYLFGQSSLNNVEIVRVGAPYCDKAYSYYTSSADLNKIVRSLKAGYNLQCLRNNILISSWGESSTTVYNTVIETPWNAVPALKTFSYLAYHPYMTSAAVFYAPVNQTVRVINIDGYYGRVTSVKNTSNEVIVKRNSIDNLPVTTDSILGGNLTYVLDANVTSKITVFNHRQSMVTLTRTDVVRVLSDEVFHVKDGIIFEEHNRNIGYLSCTEKINFLNKTFDRTCALEHSVSIGRQRIAEVHDETDQCQGIVVLVESKDTAERTFYFYDKKLKRMLTIGKVSDKDTFRMTCNSKFVFAVAWNTSSAAPTVVEFFFNRASQALSSPADPDIGFGLKGLARIRDGYFNGTDFILCQWFSNTSILSIEFYKFKESSAPLGTYQKAGVTDYNHLPFFNDSFRVGILNRHYVPFNSKAIGNNTLLRVFFGDTFGGNRKHRGMLLYNMSMVGFTEVLGVFFHEVSLYSAFSVHGTQSMTVNGRNVTYTLIALLIASDDPRVKVFQVYNTTKKYNYVRSTDNANDIVYFHVKEFSDQTDVIRFYLGSSFLTANFGVVEQNTLTLSFTARNGVKSLPFFIPVKFQNVSAINVTAKNDLEYKSGTVLTLLPGMAKNISGHVTSIELAPDSTAKLRRNRVQPLPLSTVSLAGLTPPTRPRDGSALNVKAQSDWGVEAVFVQEDQTFYVFRNQAFLVACPSNFTDTLAAFQISLARANLARIYLVYQSQDTNALYSQYIDLSTTPPTCQKFTRVMAYTNNENINLGSSASSFAVIPNPGKQGPTFGYILAVINPNSIVSYYYEYLYTSTRYVAYTPELYGPTSPVPQFKPLGNSTVCKYLQSDVAETVPLSLILCFVPGPDATSIAVTNLVHGSSLTSRTHAINATQVGDLQGLDWHEAKCALLTLNRISCVIFDAYGSLTEFFLSRDTTTANLGCTDTRFFCITLEPEVRKYSPHGSIGAQSVEVSAQFLLSVVKKKQSEVVLDDATSFVYKREQSETFYTRELGKYATRDSFVFKFFGNSATLAFQFDPVAMKVQFFEVGELELEFTSPTLGAVQGLLNFSNWDPPEYGHRLQLKTLFKSEALAAVPPPLPPPPKSFLQKFWWVFAAAALLLAAAVGYFLYRREQLRKASKAEKDEVCIDSLTEFYYKK